MLQKCTLFLHIFKYVEIIFQVIRLSNTIKGILIPPTLTPQTFTTVLRNTNPAGGSGAATQLI